MRNIVSPLSGIRSPFGGRRLSSTEDASTVTWNNNEDTYTKAIFTEDASIVTWGSSADTYTQSTYGA